MFAVFPFDVSVAKFLERPRVKACGQRQFPKPFDNRHINAIRCRIADDETDLRRCGANSPKRIPCLCHIQKVTSDHVVIGFFATALQTHRRKLATNGYNLVTDGCKFRLGQHFIEIHGFWWDVLGAGANQMFPHRFLKITPAANFAHECHFQSGSISVVIIVRVGRRRDDKRGPTIRHSRALPGVIHAKLRQWLGPPRHETNVGGDHLHGLVQSDFGRRWHGLTSAW